MSQSFYSTTSQGARVCLRVTPNARASGLQGIVHHADGSAALKIRVTAPPDKGAANKAVIAILAKMLRLPKSALTLTFGQAARTKVIEIAGERDELVAALENLKFG